MKLKTLLKYKKKTKLKWLAKLRDELYQYLEEESDRYISQSVNIDIGWVNCLIEYEIDPTDSDMTESYTTYRLNVIGDIYYEPGDE